MPNNRLLMNKDPFRKIRVAMRKVLNLLYKPLVRAYLKKPRIFCYSGLKLEILPGVFHPGFFFSTMALAELIQNNNLANKSVLELGAGSGLLSLLCARAGAKVTATDVNPVALEGLKRNAGSNNQGIEIIQSDLFSAIPHGYFDLVLINPPWFPRQVQTATDLAWKSGRNYTYFEKLFSQLKERSSLHGLVAFVFGETANFTAIRAIANSYEFDLQRYSQKANIFEWHTVYELTSLNSSENIGLEKNV